MVRTAKHARVAFYWYEREAALGAPWPLRSATPGPHHVKANARAPMALLAPLRKPLLWLLAALALAAAALALASRFLVEPQDREELPPLAALLAVMAGAGLLLPRHPRAFAYSPLLSALTFVWLAGAAALGTDAALEAAAGAQLADGWRAAAAAAVALAAVVLVLKRWSSITGLRRAGELPAAQGASPEAATEPSSHLRLLSWNVYLRSVASERVGDNDAKELRAARLADPARSPLRDYDAVCLQEMVGTANFRLHRLLDGARAMGFTHAITPAQPPLASLAVADSGLVVLAKRPLRLLEGRTLRGAVGPDRFMAKGVDLAELGKLPGGPRLVHTHLQSGYTQHDGPEVLRSKRRQIAQVARVWRRAGGGGGGGGGGPQSRILCGDLNWDAREPGMHAELLGALQAKAGSGSGGGGSGRQVRDLLLPDGRPPQLRPATIRVTYDARGRELDVNFYSSGRRKPRPGTTTMLRSVDYVLADGPLAAGSAAAAVRFSPPEGAPAMSDHLAVSASFGPPARRR
jgi:endonuclease/exonuclease/phosphatase family metal-dependent hydrolase